MSSINNEISSLMYWNGSIIFFLLPSVWR
jgi:hypothetical protein